MAKRQNKNYYSPHSSEIISIINLVNILPAFSLGSVCVCVDLKTKTKMQITSLLATLYKASWLFIYKLLSNSSQQYTVEHLLCPGHDTGVSYAFYHLILVTFLWGRNYYFTHLQIKQLKPSFLATRLSEKWLAQTYTASKWQNQYRYKIYSQIVFLKDCTKFIFLSAMWILNHAPHQH